jgi:hypothetical protein
MVRHWSPKSGRSWDLRCDAERAKLRAVAELWLIRYPLVTNIAIENDHL